MLNKIRVLHINRAENSGGAARAANRLHKSLLKNNIDSEMLVMEKFSDDPTVTSPFSKLGHEYNKLLPNISALPILFYNKTRKRTIFSPQFMARNLSKYINDINPDIVHLHWINAGFMDLKTLLEINKPIVWSVHDNWPFTGGCHVMGTCEGYKTGCGQCPILGSTQKIDLSFLLNNKKREIISKLPGIKVIGLSKWMESRARESLVFRDNQILNLPNLIDTEVYTLRDRDYSRSLFKIPKDKKVILFGAYHAASDKNKGYDLLCETLAHLKEIDFEIVLFGSHLDTPIHGKRVHALGHVSDDVTLSHLYSAADVTIVPSRQENLSNVIMESLSCGTPVVCFKTGGNEDLVDHMKSGYVASSFDTLDLSEGVKFVFSSTRKDLSDYAREKVLKNFDSKGVSDRYISLYQDCLRGK